MKRILNGFLKGLVEVFPAYGVLIVMAVLLAAITGWVLNIIKLVQDVVEPNAELTLEIFVRALGIFATPIGAVMGYF